MDQSCTGKIYTDTNWREMETESQIQEKASRAVTDDKARKNCFGFINATKFRSVKINIVARYTEVLLNNAYKYDVNLDARYTLAK